MMFVLPCVFYSEIFVFYSEIFINELPDNKKIRTYAKQKPVRLKRRLLTVEVDYENLFANGMVNNPSVSV